MRVGRGAGRSGLRCEWGTQQMHMGRMRCAQGRWCWAQSPLAAEYAWYTSVPRPAGGLVALMEMNLLKVQQCHFPKAIANKMGAQAEPLTPSQLWSACRPLPALHTVNGMSAELKHPLEFKAALWQQKWAAPPMHPADRQAQEADVKVYTPCLHAPGHSPSRPSSIAKVCVSVHCG